MTKRLLSTILASLAMATMSFPALSGETAPSRTAWQSADIQSEEIIEWVYEGCAAYPVTKEATSTAASDSKPETDLLKDAAQSGQDLVDVDHAETQ